MIQIGAVEFDEYEGDIIVPRNRVVTFARTDKANAGLQVLPAVGPPFSIRTLRYDTAAAYLTSAATILGYIGTTKAIIADGITYASTYSCNFIIEDVFHYRFESQIRAIGNRSSSYNYSPAVKITTEWRMRAV